MRRSPRPRKDMGKARGEACGGRQEAR